MMKVRRRDSVFGPASWRASRVEDNMLKHMMDGHCLRLEGTLDESLSRRDIQGMLASARQAVGPGVLKLDLAAVQTANSMGIRNWLTAQRQVPGPVCYVRMPTWLVDQCNMIEEFVAGEVQVESLFAPFYCVQTREIIQRLLTVGVDVPLLTDYASFDYPVVSVGGQEFEPDFDCTEHFSFLRLVASRMRSSA